MILKLTQPTFPSAFVLTAVLVLGFPSPKGVQAAEIELAGGVFVDVTSLRKKDLPRGFPFQVFQEGFAILAVAVRNDSSASFHIDPEVMEAKNHKKKRIKRARSTDITPKIMKYYRAGQMSTHGGIYSWGRPPQDPRYGGQNPRQGGLTHGTERSVDLGRDSQPGVVSAGAAQKVRALLKDYEIQPHTIPAGESVEGFFYLKSKKSGRKLSGQLLLSDGNEASVRF